MPDLQLLENFFLEAAAATYAGGADKSTIADLPNSKAYRYQRDSLLYTDTYWTNGEYSGGKTVIYANEIPVWMMDYDGWCQNDDKKVLAFLKRALSSTYTTNRFICGRGPYTFFEYAQGQAEGLVYTNNPDPTDCNFDFFTGWDMIFRTSERVKLYWHRYKGIALFGHNGQKRKLSQLTSF